MSTNASDPNPGDDRLGAEGNDALMDPDAGAQQPRRDQRHAEEGLDRPGEPGDPAEEDPGRVEDDPAEDDV